MRTPRAKYLCTRPAASYRKLQADLEGRAALCFEVYEALTPAAGGSATASMDEVVAHLVRAKVAKGYLNKREALRLNGRCAGEGHRPIAKLSSFFNQIWIRVGVSSNFLVWCSLV